MQHIISQDGSGNRLKLNIPQSFQSLFDLFTCIVISPRALFNLLLCDIIPSGKEPIKRHFQREGKFLMVIGQIVSLSHSSRAISFVAACLARQSWLKSSLVGAVVKEGE